MKRRFNLLLILIISMWGLNASAGIEDVISTAPRDLGSQEITITITSQDAIQKKYFDLKKENTAIVSNRQISSTGYSFKQRGDINNTYTLAFKADTNKPTCTMTFQIGPDSKILDQDCNYQLMSQGTKVTLKSK